MINDYRYNDKYNCIFSHLVIYSILEIIFSRWIKFFSLFKAEWKKTTVTTSYNN